MNTFSLYKIIILNGLPFLIFANIQAQSPNPNSDKNYVMEHTVKVQGITDKSQIGSKTVSEVNRSIQYVDGLGRANQAIMFSASPGGKDIVQHMAYDAYGRQPYKYLPYVAAASSGAFVGTAAADQDDFYDPNTPPSLSANVAKDTDPFSQTIFEPSPLNRVLKQGAPGAAWQPDQVIANNDHAVKFDYATNGTGEVYAWEITTLGDRKLSASTYYAANELYVTVTKDENWDSGQTNINDGTVKEYKDKQGRVVLKRSYESNAAHDTYYVYDDFGNLRVVLPPEAMNQLGTSLENINESNVFTADGSLTGTKTQAYYYCPGVTVTLSPTFTGQTGFELKPYPVDAELVEKFLFTYKYDDRQRMIEKKVPGVDPVYMVYDKRDRLVLTQDGNQRLSNQWTFTKYDQLNRPVLTGTYVKSGDQASVQTAVNAFYSDPNNPYMYENLSGTWTGGDHGYTDQSYPVGIGEYNYLSVSYYDKYSFTGGNSSFAFDNGNGINNGTDLLSIPKGQATGGKVKVLGDNVFLRSVVYYDKKYRVIQSRGEHYMDDMQESFMAYDFIGQVTKSKLVHHIDASTSIAITERFEYDHAGRLMKAWHQMDDQTEVLMTENQYNELGELIYKKLHYNEESSDYTQSVDYRYNIRGWLSNINNATRTVETNVNDDSNDLFGMNLAYNTDPLSIGATAQYNGNISAMAWSNASYNGSQHAYNFGYDKLNRLTAASYKEKTGTLWNVNTGHFNVSGIEYDQNGNIKELDRKEANTLIDELMYSYDGNRLLAVNDQQNHTSGFKDGEESAEEYLYDANGNMITDKNKEIQTIDYNLLNLPEKITFETGDYLEYIYDAAGTKLAKKVYENATLTKDTKYVGGMIFDNDTLKIIQTAEGRIVADLVANDYAWDYQYNLKDHLGNNRVVFKSDEIVYTVTMETAYETTEEAEFKNLDKTRYTSTTYNHTAADGTVTSPNKSAMLNATLINSDGTRRMIGPAKGLKVYQGDVIDMEVWARYNQVNTSETSVSTFLFAAMTASFGVTALENPQVYSAFNSFIGATTLINQSSGDVPKSFLNYIFFDNNYENPEFGFVQVSSAASSAHQKLSLSKTIGSEGYLYIYVSNESTLNVDVFFDDLKITHSSPSMVVQANDYYPFGLTFNSWQNPEEQKNNFLYQGKELEKDLGLDIYDFESRGYDPALGRTWQLDPHLENYYDWSPYSWTGNNPILMIDPDGMDWYSNQESGDLEWIDVTPGEDETDESYKYQKGYDYLGGADASIDDIRDKYNFLQGDGAFGFSQHTQLMAHQAGQKFDEFVESVNEVPEKMHQADLALTNFGSSIKSMELGISGKIGIKSAYISGKIGFYSTGENTAGVFLNISGKLDVNSSSIQDFASFDYSGQGYLSLQTTGGVENSPFRGSVKLGIVSGSASSDGKINIGVGFRKPGYSANVGFSKGTDIWNLKSKEIQISR